MNRTSNEIEELVDFFNKNLHNSKITIENLIVDGRLISNEVEKMLSYLDGIDTDKIDISRAKLTLFYTSPISKEELVFQIELYPFQHVKDLKETLSEIVIEEELDIYRKRYKQRIENISKINS